MNDARIDEIRDERGGGGDFFVYLKPGFALSSPPQHCFGARTKTDIRKEMRGVFKCACEECLQLIATETAA